MEMKYTFGAISLVSFERNEGAFKAEAIMEFRRSRHMIQIDFDRIGEWTHLHRDSTVPQSL